MGIFDKWKISKSSEIRAMKEELKDERRTVQRTCWLFKHT